MPSGILSQGCLLSTHKWASGTGILALSSVPAGTLDNAKMPVPDAHLWVDSKQPWDSIPEGMPQFPGNFPPEEAKKLFSRNNKPVLRNLGSVLMRSRD